MQGCAFAWQAFFGIVSYWLPNFTDATEKSVFGEKWSQLKGKFSEFRYERIHADTDSRRPSCRCTDVWATRRLGDRRLGDNFFVMIIWATRVGRLGDSIWTFERQASRRLGDKNEALRLEQPQRRGSCKRLSVFSCFGTHFSKVHRRSNTDWQTKAYLKSTR